MAKVNVWVPSPIKLYTVGTVVKDELQNNNVTVSVWVTGESAPRQIDKSLTFPHQDGLTLALTDDLTSLRDLNIPNLLHALEFRYNKSRIYTFVSNVLIAVNPYADIALYDIHRYRENYKDPHIFAIAQCALDQLTHLDPRTLCHQPQSIICCGESGSGKTVSSKQVLRYLCSGSVSGNKVTQHVLNSNPVLEAFGNAQTLRNKNSSRFAKFVKIHFTEHERSTLKTVATAHTETYLLERSRLTFVPEGERNFHIFYGLSIIKAPRERFRYLGASADTLDEISHQQLIVQFQTVDQTLQSFGIQSSLVWDLCLGILYLGNIEHDHSTHSDTFVPKTQYLQTTAQLLGLGTDELRMFLETRKLVVGKETVVVKYSVSDGTGNRDSMAKYLYTSLFQSIIDKMNGQFPSLPVSQTCWIGLLDVFGFESFKMNSFEQFCINLANEKLQHFFNYYILDTEQELYRTEYIIFQPISLENTQNVDTLQLLEGRPSGIIHLLDSVCIMPKGSPQILTDNIYSIHHGHPRLERTKINSGSVFTIQHFAGTVTYTTTEFLSRNNDTKSQDLLTLLQQSCNQFVQSAATVSFKGQQKSRFTSVGRVFQGQLTLLLETLKSTTPFFVRCINPNPRQCAGDFDWTYIEPQIRLSGLLQAVEMLKFGYPFRLSYRDVATPLLAPLSLLISYELTHPMYLRNICEALFKYTMKYSCSDSEVKSKEKSTSGNHWYQLGLTKIFFRSGQQGIVDKVLEYTRAPPQDLLLSISQWIKKRQRDRLKGGIRTILYLQQRLHGIRIRYQWRRMVRRAMIIKKTFYKVLAKIRKQKHRLSRPSKNTSRSHSRVSFDSRVSFEPILSPPEMDEIITLQQNREVLIAEQSKLKEETRLVSEEREKEFKKLEETYKNEVREEREKYLGLLAQQETILASKLHTLNTSVEEMTIRCNELIQEKERLRQDHLEIKTFYETSVIGAQDVIQQFQQQLKKKETFIEKLEKQIQQLQIQHNQQHTLYEERIRQLERSLYQQQQEVRRLSTKSIVL